MKQNHLSPIITRPLANQSIIDQADPLLLKSVISYGVS